MIMRGAEGEVRRIFISRFCSSTDPHFAPPCPLAWADCVSAKLPTTTAARQSNSQIAFSIV